MGALCRRERNSTEENEGTNHRAAQYNKLLSLSQYHCCIAILKANVSRPFNRLQWPLIPEPDVYI